MARKIISVCLVLLLAAAVAAAGGTKEEAMAELMDLREKKAAVTEDYKANLEKIEREAEEKMAQIKKNFRLAREECLAQRHDRSDALRKEYEAMLRPMIKEEEELVELVGRDAREDFAKPGWARKG